MVGIFKSIGKAFRYGLVGAAGATVGQLVGLKDVIKAILQAVLPAELADKADALADVIAYLISIAAPVFLDQVRSHQLGWKLGAGEAK